MTFSPHAGTIGCCSPVVGKMLGLELAMIGGVVEECDVQNTVDDGGAGECSSGV
jgi:hypothetical protein